MGRNGRTGALSWVFLLLAVGVSGSAADAPAPVPGFTPEDFAAHLKVLTPTVPAGFTVIVQSPFVVIGDEKPDRLRYRAQQNVLWATTLLQREYFPKNPQFIYDVWLFKDKDSYETNAEKLFGAKPTTPYGYCSDAHHALVMNIATGGGTLIHEMTHAFMHGNFPECPTWFNEGLASLYEQCGEQDGRIRGLCNWRLPALQEAIVAKKVPSFAALTATSSDEFYEKDRGTNYAQARYLLYYLQGKGLLQDYYREFTAHHQDDPTGYKSLVKILKVTDLDAFQREWEAFTLALPKTGE